MLNPTHALVLLCLAAAAAQATDAVPDARAHYQLVYHAGDERVYLIGGSTRRGGGYHYFDDMWFWDGRDWTRISSLPFPRSSHRVVYHAGRNSLILFGGGFAQAVRAEGILWEWRRGEWKAIGGNVRAGTGEPEMCYDAKRGRIVIFGGWDAANSYRGDTWESAGADLVRIESAGPSPRAGHGFLYDPVRERCLLFGGQGADGYLADTWHWDGATWERLDVAGPSPRWFFGSATDPEHGRIVIFGGRGPGQGRDGASDLGDTWAWDGTRWEQLSAEGPSARGARLAFTGRGILLFGGREETPQEFRDLQDTWELQGRTWVRRR